MKQHVTIANATDQPILPTTNASAELEKAGFANAETDTNKKDSNEQSNKWVVFAILAVGIFMATLDTAQWQTLPEKLSFQSSQVGSRILAKTELLPAGFFTLLQVCT